jgi:hypothetical protein
MHEVVDLGENEYAIKSSVENIPKKNGAIFEDKL